MDKIKKVLFVRANNTSPRVTKEATSLAKNYSVTVLLWNRKSNMSHTKYENGYEVIEFGYNAPYGRKVIFYWVVWWYAIFKYLLKNKFDVIHVCGLDSYPPVLLLRTFKKYHIVYDIFDFMADSLPVGTPQIIVNFVSYIERKLTNQADGVIIVDDSRRNQLNGIDISNLEVIMNCVDDHIGTYAYDVVSDNFFTVFYGGMLSFQYRGLDKIINVVKDMPDIKLIIAGNGEDEDKIKVLCMEYNNIEFLGQISNKKALELTYKSDVVFAFYNPAIPINRLASPNKLFEAMMCGTPIIINSETSIAKVVEEENCGLIVPYDEETALKEAIINLNENAKLKELMGRNGRKAFKEGYNWSVMEKRLLHLYQILN
ncbi:MAG: glycosyltransferase family 4 protein [Peptococcia bacterium]|jgi:glycosyltransferase involved in cell wall biosynthesis